MLCIRNCARALVCATQLCLNATIYSEGSKEKNDYAQLAFVMQKLDKAHYTLGKCSAIIKLRALHGNDAYA